METEPVSVALVVATGGRTRELEILFKSLDEQDFKDFEIVVVDQNRDNRLEEICARWQSRLKVRRLWTPSERGASRARNTGWVQTQCPIVLFPDDDCWYPPSFLSRVLNVFRATNADIVCGRAADTEERDINGRFESAAQWVTRENVWTTQIEWMIIFKRDALEAVGGFDPTIGVGASTPWQSCEGQDIVLRGLAKGLKCYYDNSLYGHHPELNIYSPDKEMRRKGRLYARGMGHVLQLHHYTYWSLLNWVSRPIVKACLFLLLGKFDRARYYRNVALGRWEGWSGRLLADS
jgi:glycosyltransferase involved in cell wall biosynthesis